MVYKVTLTTEEGTVLVTSSLAVEGLIGVTDRYKIAIKLEDVFADIDQAIFEAEVR